jgi:RES domain-containing protein
LSLKELQSLGYQAMISDSKEYGNKWLEEQRSLILVVPSIVIPQEKNYIINPNHPEFD